MDRTKFGDSNVVGYYIKHFDEARERLQVLCANCNHLKSLDEKEQARSTRLEFRFPELWVMGKVYKEIAESVKPVSKGNQIPLPFGLPQIDVISLMREQRALAESLLRPKGDN